MSYKHNHLVAVTSKIASPQHKTSSNELLVFELESKVTKVFRASGVIKSRYRILKSDWKPWSSKRAT